MLFKINNKVISKIQDAEVLKRIKNGENLNVKKNATNSNKIKPSNSLIDRIEAIRQDVEENLGVYKSKYKILTDLNEIEHYIDIANKDDEIAIDTETFGLNVLVDDIVGLCLYSPSQYGVYIPINHVDYITNERFDVQPKAAQLKPLLDKLTAKIIMFNAKFDLRVIKNWIGSNLTCYWDCLLGAKLLNENDLNYSLKTLYTDCVARTNKAAKTFNDLFDGISIAKVPIELAYLYGAHDPVMTYDLYKFQTHYLNPNSRQDLANIFKLATTIEMPCIKSTTNMESRGCKLDLDFVNNYLKPRYEELRDIATKKCYDAIDMYSDIIEEYRKHTPQCKLSNPIKLSSSSQIAILLYDVLKESPKDKKFPRGTGEEILKKMNHPFIEPLLELRGIDKLLSTYIYAIPEYTKYDGKVHYGLNQYGARSGRFSSSSPNIQNIPSKNKEIRQMFIPDTIEKEHVSDNGYFELEKSLEVQLHDGTWKFVEQLCVGDILNDSSTIIDKIEVELSLNGVVKLWVKQKEIA